jgi:hypothetical protein
MRHGLVGLAVALLLAACADAGRAAGGNATPPGASLDVRCDGATTELGAASVQARTDGVHLVVHNSSGTTLLVGWNGGGDGADPGETPFVFPILPGEGKIRCQRTSEDPGAPGGWATFEVHPPEGWVSPTIDCPDETANGVIDYVAGARGVPDPRTDVERDVSSGEVQFAGYHTDEKVTVVVSSDGVPVGAYDYISDGHDGWLRSTTTACS